MVRHYNQSGCSVFESVWVNAFVVGLVSACSMPLGSMTSLVWTPKNRVIAFLMAFGGGALLAALVIDLVGNATEKGHLLELVIGSIIGSLFFTLTNQWVNRSGGFLRKPSTTLLYTIQQKRDRLTQSISQLKRIKFFQDLSEPLRQKIAQVLLVAHYPKGTILYRQGDPSESLYLIRVGKVNILDPQANFNPIVTVTTHDLVGQFAFFTGSPHQTVASVTEDCQLEILTRSDFEQLLETSPELLQTTARIFQQENIKNYLRQRQGLDLAQIKEWVRLAQISLYQERKIKPAVEINQRKSDFLHLARQIHRFPIFSYLSQEDLEEIADRLVYIERPNGYVFFQPGDIGDRYYMIHQGKVQILYPSQLQQPALVLTSGDPFGELSFITGTFHTVTAIAQTDVGVWTLRRQDFDELLQQSSALEERIKTFLEQPRLKDYLLQRQKFEPTKAVQWVQQALKSMNAGTLIPSATMMSSLKDDRNQAPIAIWLGLLIDAIPEALTIGAHLATASISPSLLAGLFIANYPEALSSSDGMKKQGFSIPKILGMWTAIMLITGLLSALGSILFADAPDSIISLLEAMAAGAMLTVISETMLPEAYAKGGSIVGLSTVLGFLVIIILTQ